MVPPGASYDAVNAMLLNEFLKEHRIVQEQGVRITQQRKDFEAAIEKQQREIQALTATIKEQAAQIQKVSAQLELNKPAPQTVLNNQ
jgi:septal ring factor EnvC (AmiA/AmiB activator)